MSETEQPKTQKEVTRVTAAQDEDFDYEGWERMLAEEPFDPRTDPFYSHPEDVRDPDPPGTPDEDEDWLAPVPPEVRDDFLSDPFTGAGETFAAGFLHHDGGRRGTGFAAGGILDQMDAGPLLAQFVQAFGTNHRQMAQLGESELIGLL